MPNVGSTIKNTWEFINAPSEEKYNGKLIKNMTDEEKKEAGIETQEGIYPITGVNFEEILKEYNNESRKHQLEIWEREDSAYQRAAEDARKAGINPNLVGLEPAQTTSTYQNSIDTELGSTFDTLLQGMQQEFEKVENDQKQENDLLGKFLVGAVTILAAVIMKKK